MFDGLAARARLWSTRAGVPCGAHERSLQFVRPPAPGQGAWRRVWICVHCQESQRSECQTWRVLQIVETAVEPSRLSAEKHEGLFYARDHTPEESTDCLRLVGSFGYISQSRDAASTAGYAPDRASIVWVATLLL